VPNKMFYLLSDGGMSNGIEVTGIGIDAAFKIMYRANMFYWTELTDFDDGMEGSITAAGDLDPTGEWAQQVENAWHAVCVGIAPNVMPVADPGGPYNGNEDSPIFFDGSGSYDMDGRVISYNWDFGDSSFGTGVAPVHVYEEAGSYTVTLIVRDDMGALSYDGTTTVEVTPVSAVALSSFDLVSFDGMVSIVWQTAFERDHQGFHLERRELRAGEDGGTAHGESSADHFTRINRELIRGDGRRGTAYEYVDRTALPGHTYQYRLEAIDRLGESQFLELRTITVAQLDPRPAHRPTLHQNRPNPFNPRTTISFELPAAERVVVRIYDSSGRQVRMLADRRYEPGPASIEWDGRDDSGRQLNSGVYVCRVQVGGQVLSRKIVMVR